MAAVPVSTEAKGDPGATVVIRAAVGIPIVVRAVSVRVRAAVVIAAPTAVPMVMMVITVVPMIVMSLDRSSQREPRRGDTGDR
jgi:hypothetical protein